MSVENDNIKFMREKERSSNASVKNISNSWQFKDDRNDPDQDRSRGCGGGGFNTPGRFVCWKRSRGQIMPPPLWSKWPLWPQGFNTPSRFVCHRRRHKKRKIKFMSVYWAWIILLGCFLYFLLIAIWFTSYYGGKGWSKIYLVTKVIFLVMKSSSLWRL